MTKCSVFNEKRNFKTVEYKYGEFNYTIVSTMVVEKMTNSFSTASNNEIYNKHFLHLGFPFV